MQIKFLITDEHTKINTTNINIIYVIAAKNKYNIKIRIY